MQEHSTLLFWDSCIWHLPEDKGPVGSILANRRLSTVAELASLALLICTIYWVDGLGTLFTPIVTAILIIVYSFDSGSLSQILSRPLFANWGKIAFSVYLIHFFIQKLFYIAFEQLSLHTNLITYFINPDDQEKLILIGNNKWLGDIATVTMATTVILSARLIVKYIEDPSHKYIRKLTEKLYSPKSEQLAVTSN